MDDSSHMKQNANESRNSGNSFYSWMEINIDEEKERNDIKFHHYLNDQLSSVYYTTSSMDGSSCILYFLTYDQISKCQSLNPKINLNFLFYKQVQNIKQRLFLFAHFSNYYSYQVLYIHACVCTNCVFCLECIFRSYDMYANERFTKYST